jgi:hypothetical protein
MPIGDPSSLDFHTICTILADVDRVTRTNQTTAISHSGWLSIAYHEPLLKMDNLIQHGADARSCQRIGSVIAGVVLAGGQQYLR